MKTFRFILQVKIYVTFFRTRFIHQDRKELIVNTFLSIISQQYMQIYSRENDESSHVY